MGPEIVYFWRLMEEIVGPLSENKIWVAVFLLDGNTRKIQLVLLNGFYRIIYL
jgi:hypothetical protein